MKVVNLSSKAEAIKAYNESTNDRATACKYFGNNAFIKEAVNSKELTKLCDEYIANFQTCVTNLQYLKEGATDWEAQKKKDEIANILRGIDDPNLKEEFKALLS
jgi:hypothetical protein